MSEEEKNILKELWCFMKWIKIFLFTIQKQVKKEKLEIIRKFLIEKIKNSYKIDINNFTNVLEDDGALAAILGYDAILVREKNYIIILNRSKLVINDTNLYEQLDNLENNNSNNIKN